MNILQVSMRDLVGQRFNGYQLHRALRARGEASRMLVIHKGSNDADVHDFSRAGAWFERGLYAAERVTGLQGLLSPIGLTLPLRRCFREAEVVHWHLVHPHFLGTSWVPFASRLRPTVWTLHDPWAMTGHCVHPLDCTRWQTGCGHCPDLKRNFSVWVDATALVWRTKRLAYSRSPVQLVVASGWMKERVDQSPLLSSMPCRVIPFGLDLAAWPRLDRSACRASLGIAPQAKVIAFRTPPNEKLRLAKGVPTLVEALQRLEPREPVTLVTFEGRGDIENLRHKYRIIELGWVEDVRKLAEALTAADVFAMPSVAESFGFMALEAMACGTAAIVTAGTALAETVRPPEAGLAVAAGDAGALAGALTELLNDDARRLAMGESGRRRVASEYSYERYLRSHLDLYQELAAARPGRRPGGAR